MSIYHTYTWINIYSARRRRRGERWRGSRRTWRTWRRAWRRCGTARPRRKSTRCGGSEDTVLVQHSCALIGAAAFKLRSGMQRKAASPIRAHICACGCLRSRQKGTTCLILIPVYGNRGVARQRGGDRRLGVYIRQHELARAEALPRDGLCAGAPYDSAEDRQQHHT